MLFVVRWDGDWRFYIQSNVWFLAFCVKKKESKSKIEKAIGKFKTTH